MKQEYAFSVFDHVIRTSDGKALLQKHYGTNNAQELWKKFVINAKVSTKAKHT
jgi:2-hydroxy-3-keto-5-methylthiopentenyl-1-phosphate phosphatase